MREEKKNTSVLLKLEKEFLFFIIRLALKSLSYDRVKCFHSFLAYGLIKRLASQFPDTKAWLFLLTELNEMDAPSHLGS